ncbi:MAG: hypothetical protein V1809_03140 [Planctomycetota bacterium]
MRVIHFALILTLCGLAVSCSTSKCLPYRYETVSRTVENMYPPGDHSVNDIRAPSIGIEPPTTEPGPNIKTYPYRIDKKACKSGGSTYTVTGNDTKYMIRGKYPYLPERVTTISINPKQSRTRISIKSKVHGLIIGHRDPDYERARLRDIETELKRRQPPTP